MNNRAEIGRGSKVKCMKCGRTTTRRVINKMI